MRVVFMGTPDFAVPSLDYLVLNNYEVVAVYTQPDRVAGRGRSLTASPVKIAAGNRGLAVVVAGPVAGSAVVAELAGFHPDVIVVAAFGQILPQSVLDIPRYGCINVHASLLPRFRGASPIAAAILAGDEFTGVSIMRMEKGLDTGPVFTRAQIPIDPRDTTGTLTEKLSRIAAPMLIQVLISWERGEITPRVQSDEGITYSGQFNKEDGEINWTRPAVEIGRRVRAFQPWPESYTRWQGKQFKIIEAVPLDGDKSAAAGQVVALSSRQPAFGVATGDGVLGVVTVQIEGKRAMPAVEFLRGQRQFIGAILPTI